MSTTTIVSGAGAPGTPGRARQEFLRRVRAAAVHKVTGARVAWLWGGREL